MLTDLIRTLQQLLWPVACPVCGAADAWCLPCRPDGPATEKPVSGAGPVLAAVRYEAGAAEAIRAWKLHGRRDLTEPLGELLGAALTRAGLHPVVLVPIPARPASRRRRGRDVVADLARAAARNTPDARVESCLQWRRRVADQVGSGAAERAQNVAGALRVARSPPSGPVLVVDDIVTTGATLAEASRALWAAGSGPLAAVALAASPGRAPMRERRAFGDSVVPRPDGRGLL